MMELDPIETKRLWWSFTLHQNKEQADNILIFFVFASNCQHKRVTLLLTFYLKSVYFFSA